MCWIGSEASKRVAKTFLMRPASDAVGAGERIFIERSRQPWNRGPACRMSRFDVDFEL